MTQQNGSGGFLTQRDKDWLTGDLEADEDAYKSKYRLKQTIPNIMADIKTLVNVDTQIPSSPEIDGITEIFENLESETDMSTEDCAKHLIALAYILANESIDYDQIMDDLVLHRRDPGEMPGDDDRTVDASGVDFSLEVSELLRFRYALSKGIQLGKMRVEEGVDEVDIPDTVTIDCNTKLYKHPTVDRLNPRGERKLEIWRDAYAALLDTHDVTESMGIDDLPGSYDPEDGVIDPQTAFEQVATAIHLNVDDRISARRQLSNRDIKDIPHGYLPGFPNFGDKALIELDEDVHDDFQKYKQENMEEDSLTDSDVIAHLLKTAKE